MNRYLIVETAFGYSAVVFSAEPFKLVAIKLTHIRSRRTVPAL